MSLKYAIIGKNWGYKIYNVLKSMKKDVIFLNIKSQKYYKNKEIYKANARKVIKNTFVDIIWIATPPSEHFFLLNESIKNNFNVIVEKPWISNLRKTYPLIKLQKKNNLQIGVHFQYIFLKKIIELGKKKYLNNRKTFFDCFFYTNNKTFPKISPFYELGSHLVALKLFYFNKSKMNIFDCSYKKKQLRKINLFYKKKNFSVDFTNNKEKLIQRYIKDYENHLINKTKYTIDLNFACNVDKNIKYLLRQ